GAQCISYPKAPFTEANRAFALGAVVDVGAIAEWFGDTPHAVCVPPGYLGLEESLAVQGYTAGHASTKVQRGVDAAPPSLTDLRVEETLDAETFALVSGGSGVPVQLARELFSVAGAPGWRCFLAFAADEPVACGAVYA